jgi:hypothetical protein
VNQYVKLDSPEKRTVRKEGKEYHEYRHQGVGKEKPTHKEEWWFHECEAQSQEERERVHTPPRQERHPLPAWVREYLG